MIYQSDFENEAAKILNKERNRIMEPEGLIQQYIGWYARARPDNGPGRLFLYESYILHFSVL